MLVTSRGISVLQPCPMPPCVSPHAEASACPDGMRVTRIPKDINCYVVYNDLGVERNPIQLITFHNSGRHFKRLHRYLPLIFLFNFIIQYLYKKSNFLFNFLSMSSFD